MFRFLAAAVAAALLCGSAQAQRRGASYSSGGCANGACGVPSTSYFPSQSYAYSLPPAAPVQAARTVGDGHTHTCPRCSTTWDHSTNPGHNCPRCGAAQFVQDTYRKPVTGAPVPQAAPKVVAAAPAAGRSGSCSCGSVCPCLLTAAAPAPGLVVSMVP